MTPDNSSNFNIPTPGASQQPLGTSTTGPGPITANQPPLDGSSQAPQAAGTTPGQLPPAQQRQMVMPDRMRWIYRDPQGNVQGPWSGLEMHDWFKAGFFTAELQVKKLEDIEYEPLAQLVRRIGNSREPFLVPQIGVPHGQPLAQPGPTWGPAQPGGAMQPPFANSFPSFGTTLTAEQQNALERRKQEEQYLMARQKEHLAQQQALMKQMQVQTGSHTIHPQLQHHSSAHSLQSQPSYGSITSPGGFQQPPAQGPIQPPQTVPGYFESSSRQNTLPNMGSQMSASEFPAGQDELPTLLDRLNVSRGGQFPFNNPTSSNNNASPFGARQPENAMHNQAVGSMLQDRAHLQQEQEQFDQAQNDSIFDQQAREERLRQFHALRKTEEEIPVQRSDRLPTHAGVEEDGFNEELQTSNNQPQGLQTGPIGHDEPLSLTEQVQNAASAQRLQQQVQSSAGQPVSPWAKVDTGLPQPFPPPPSTSPLPAPAAQRNRQNVADALAAESRSQTQTPSETHTTSIAPWAREPTEAPKGPSLKEIQEAEARKAAKLEEVAAAARRALAEQERANQPPPVAPGLPSTANWASSGTQVSSAGNNASAWSKPATGKPQPSPAPNAPKKTLAQIQKEEEARKQRQANAAAAAAAASAAANAQQAAISTAPGSAGKRYADLASKVAPSNGSSPASGAWTTVGAGGKVKQTTPVPVAAPLRSVPGLTPSPSPVAKNRPIAPTTTTTTTTRTTTVGNAAPVASPSRPTEELTKWAKMALGKGLNSSINGKDPAALSHST